MISIEIGATRARVRHRARVTGHVHRGPHDLLTRVADAIPYVSVAAGGHEVHDAADIYAQVVAEALGAGGPPSPRDGGRADEPAWPAATPVALAVPGWWSPRVLTRVRAALAEQDVDAVLINDAEAAVAAYRHEEAELPATVAVVSLRAELSSIVIVGNDGVQPSALLSPALARDEGGCALDAAVVRHLVHGLVAAGDRIDRDDPDTIAAAHAALRQCKDLREALSQSAAESVVLELPGASQRIRIVRSELEELAIPWADAVVDMVRRAMEQSPRPVDAVLLTGGLAAMPLISQRLSAVLGSEVHVPAEPDLITVTGAERLLMAQRERTRKPRTPWEAVRSLLKRGTSNAQARIAPAGPAPLVTSAAAGATAGSEAASFEALLTGAALEAAPLDRSQIRTVSEWYREHTHAEDAAETPAPTGSAPTATNRPAPELAKR